YTWTNVEEGDELPVLVALGESIATYEVSLPAPVDGAVTYEAISGGCGGSGDGASPISFSVHDGCVHGAPGAVLLFPYDQSLARLPSSSFAKGITPPADGGTVAIDAGPFQANGEVGLTVTGAPALRSLSATFHQI